MIKFTRNLKSTAIQILEADVTENESFNFAFLCYGSRTVLAMGTECISLVVCPHFLCTNTWRIESLGEDTIIYFVGSFEECLTKFQEVTDSIRHLGHIIEEPEGYDFKTELQKRYAAFL